MKSTWYVQLSSSSWLGFLIMIILAIGAMALSTLHRFPSHLTCHGGLGAGFPAVFICEVTGQSPKGESTGRISLSDAYLGGIDFIGFIADFLFYLALIWLAWLTIVPIFHKDSRRRPLHWSGWISLGYLIGLVLATWVFQPAALANGVYIDRPATQIASSPGAFSNQPSSLTAVPTAEPHLQSQQHVQGLSSQHLSLLNENEWIIGIATRVTLPPYTCKNSSSVHNPSYIAFLVRGPLEIDMEIENGTWGHWGNLDSEGDAMNILESNIMETQPHPDSSKMPLDERSKETVIPESSFTWICFSIPA